MNIKKIVATFFATSVISTFSYANEIVAADSSNFTQLCMTALEGNRAAMHNNIKSSGYSKEFVAKNVQCNGVNILAFVEQHGKKSNAMLRMIDRSERSTLITDLAKNSVEPR